MPVMMQMSHPPNRLVAIQITTRNGRIVISARILGIARKLALLMPMISSASICSVALMVPISLAILEPILPDRIRHRMVDENSSRMISRVVRPTV